MGQKKGGGANAGVQNLSKETDVYSTDKGLSGSYSLYKETYNSHLYLKRVFHFKSEAKIGFYNCVSVGVEGCVMCVGVMCVVVVWLCLFVFVCVA